MPISISVSRWADCGEDVLLAIQQHAALKAAQPINWDEWLNLDNERFGGFDVPYSVGDVLYGVMEAFCGSGWSGFTYFVPYNFNPYLCADFPVPREFWFDDVRPRGWKNETLRIIEAVWFHTIWRGTEDDVYREQAQSYARRFYQEYEQWKERETPIMAKFMTSLITMSKPA